jgi:hypothetical protein
VADSALDDLCFAATADTRVRESVIGRRET